MNKVDAISKKINPIALFETPFVSQTNPQKESASTISVLEKEASISQTQFIPNKPQIPKPESKKSEKSFSASFAYLADQIHHNVTESLNANNQEVDVITQRMVKQQQMRLEKLKEAAAKAGQKDTWNCLQIVASCLLGTASIISGLFAVSTMNPAGIVSGGLLIGGGATSIASSIMGYLRYDPKVTGALALASAGLSLAGAGLSYFFLAHQLPQIFTSIINGAIGVTGGLSTMGKEYMEMLTQRIQGELAKINRFLSEEAFKLQQIGENSQEIAALIESQGAASLAVANYHKAMKEINVIAAQAI